MVYELLCAKRRWFVCVGGGGLKGIFMPWHCKYNSVCLFHKGLSVSVPKECNQSICFILEFLTKHTREKG